MEDGKLLQLRGDIYEGGGQILRTALALSARTRQPFQLTHIRAGRSRPGLQAQHLAAVHLAQQLCDAQLEGATKGSQQLVFRPGPLRSGHFAVDIGTAGSMTLLLQASFWALAAATDPSTVEVRGGSDVAWSPPLDYVEKVTLPLYRHLADIETLQSRRGFFPKGGGLWRFRVGPRQPQELDLAFTPHWGGVSARAVASRELQGRQVLERIRARLDLASFEGEYVPSPSPGVVLVLWSESGPLRCGATGLGEKGKSAEQLVDETLTLLRQRMNAPEGIEEHLADQLIPLLALVGGKMLCQDWTPHCMANLEVVEAFLGRRIQRVGKLLTGTIR